MVTDTPTHATMEQEDGEEDGKRKRKKRRSSTSRIVDITETLGTSQGRTRQVDGAETTGSSKEMCG